MVNMWRQSAKWLLALLALSANFPTNQAQQTEDQQVQAILANIPANSLIFNGHFGTNPASTVGGTTGYTWVDYDNVNDPNHRGVLRFNGSASSYVDMSLSTGINSVGLTLPQFGGASLGTGDRQGVTFEVVVKFDVVANWAKVFVMADTVNLNNEIQLTWDGDSDNMNRLLFQQYIQQSVVGVNYDKGLFETFRPLIGTWYHIAMVLKPVTLTVTDPNYGGGNWFLFINGQQIALADSIVTGAAFTSLQAANYPLRIARPAQYIAKSKYADPNAQFSLDAIRVYDCALNANEISRLAAVYGLNNTAHVVPTPRENKVFPASPENTIHRNSFITFDPVYRLDFAVNPASQVGGTTAYDWLPFDPTDSAEDRANHTGLVKFSNDNQYVDMMTANGPLSAGLVMPTLFTRSAGTGASYGWSFDMVFKVNSMNTWAKFFSLGTNPNQDALYTGWRGSDNLFEVGNYNMLRDTLLNVANPAAQTFYRAPLLNKWTHAAWVLEPIDKTNMPTANFSASWSLYVNGQLVIKTDFNKNWPTPVVRRYSALGASNWNDPKARMTVDAFRIWDRALNADQIETLAASYGCTGIDGGDYLWTVALGTARRPVYNLDFQANPVQNGQGPIAWQWSEQDPADSTVTAGLHTGLATLDGTANSYISLNAVTGPNRVYDGLVVPNVGGPTNPGTGYTSGWSFELVFKPLAWSQWSKFITISNARDVDEILIAFDASGDNMVVQQYVDDNAYAGNWNYAITEIVKPTIMGQWYHIVVTMRPGSTDGAGNWQVFINGQLQDWATRVMTGMTFTEVQGANYPRAVSRTSSYLGKSNFADANMRVTYDAFRIFDYVLTPAQVTSFATAYGLNIPLALPTPADNRPFPVTSETTNWQTVGLTTPPVFNAVFSDNPASLVGGVTHYQWIGVDPTDSAEDQQRHRGIIVLNGTDAAFVDLTVVTGPKSVGLVMPVIGGAGSGTGTARGMTMEMVVKLLAVRGWSKLLEISSGPDIDSLVFGWNNDRYNTIEMHNFNAVRPGLNKVGSMDIMSQPPLGRWLHIACSLRLTDDTRWEGEWSCYVDGELVGRKLATDATNPANYPLPLYRQDSYLAKSAWEDPNAAMMVDMVRIHDYAQTQAQIRSTATQYGQYGVVRPPTNTTLPFPDTPESTAVAGIVTRRPVFNAWFGSDPTTLVSTPTPLTYTWQDYDPTDSSTDQQKHRGIVKLTGAATSFIDVNTNTGPNSCGVVVPVLGGPGSGVGAEQGWSFEVVFKVTRMNGWAKLFDFGNGPDIGNIVMGVDGTDVSSLYVDVFDNAQLEYPHGLAELFTPQMGKWYHVMWQVAPVNITAGSAVYYFYVNGKLLGYTDAIIPRTAFTPVQGAAYPKRFSRRYSYLGKSNWNDPLFEGALDAIRIYDYIVPADQVSRLADFYGCNNNEAVLPTPALNKAVNPSTVAEVRAWDREGIVEPVFNANFGMDPRPLVGGTSRYTWMDTDPADTDANKQVHKGLIYLDGSEQSFIDLMKAEGPNSCGLVIPTLFSASSGVRNEKGWTIELVAKIGRTEVWSKLWDFGTGGSDWMDSLAISWWGDQPGNLIIQNFNNLNPIPSQPREEQNFPFLRPALNRWYHITLVMQPLKPLDSFGAVWRVYVDGTLVNRTTTQSNYPLAVVRDNSFIGASQWGFKDTDRMSQMTVDALRIYDRALLPTQVAALARMYNLQPTVIPEPDLADWINEPLPGTGSSTGSNSGSTGSQTGTDSLSTSSSSSLSGGAIAGIVIGSVVGAALICIVLGCLCCSKTALGGKKKSADDFPAGTGGYGEVEASSNQSQHSHEVEMEETGA